jgi:hypothetical protein
MPPHSPNMYRDPYNTAAAASPLSAPRQLVASPSRLRNVNSATAVPASPNFSAAAAPGSPAALTSQSSRFQAAAPASPPGVRNLASDAADSQYNYNGSPHTVMRSAPVIPQTLHLAQSSPQVGKACVNIFYSCKVLFGIFLMKKKVINSTCLKDNRNKGKRKTKNLKKFSKKAAIKFTK